MSRCNFFAGDCLGHTHTPSSAHGRSYLLYSKRINFRGRENPSQNAELETQHVCQQNSPLLKLGSRTGILPVTSKIFDLLDLFLDWEELCIVSQEWRWLQGTTMARWAVLLQLCLVMYLGSRLCVGKCTFVVVQTYKTLVMFYCLCCVSWWRQNSFKLPISALPLSKCIIKTLVNTKI